jgi:hypothetical protein
VEKINIFISIGKTSTDEQDEFAKSIEQYLRDHNLIPRAVNRTDFTSSQPLKFIKQLMNQCSGVIVIAFERTYIIDGIEQQGRENKRFIKNETLPTVWNQIEATMAYVLGQPLLMIAQSDLHVEGLLENDYDWFVQKVNINASTLHSRQFEGTFSDWRKRVESYHQNKQKNTYMPQKDVDMSKLTIRQIVGSLNAGQFWGLVVAIILIISTMSTLAFNLGILSTHKP